MNILYFVIIYVSIIKCLLYYSVSLPVLQPGPLKQGRSAAFGVEHDMAADDAAPGECLSDLDEGDDAAADDAAAAEVTLAGDAAAGDAAADDAAAGPSMSLSTVSYKIWRGLRPKLSP